MRRFLFTVAVGVVLAGLSVTPALACGGLIGRNGSVNLVRTTTLAEYHDGVEHYVTAFKFAGVGGAFGSIVPLPGVPTSVERGGDWTLQRLEKEVNPPVVAPLLAQASAATNGADKAQVLLETQVDALDITVLKGGAQAVGQWATDNGFLLTPDAPAMLDFYARRSPIFLAARFDAAAVQQKGVSIGDGTPVQITIPTDNPWVPLHILGLGLQPTERVEADVFLLTDHQPSLLPAGNGPGLSLVTSEPASDQLLSDLRSDKGTTWIPASSWLSFLRVDAAPADLTYDLAVDASGGGHPSVVAAGGAQALANAGSGTGSNSGGPGSGGPGSGGSGWPVLPILLGGSLGLLVLIGGAGIAVWGRSRRSRSSAAAGSSASTASRVS